MTYPSRYMVSVRVSEVIASSFNPLAFMDKDKKMSMVRTAKIVLSLLRTTFPQAPIFKAFHKLSTCFLASVTNLRFINSESLRTYSRVRIGLYRACRIARAVCIRWCRDRLECGDCLVFAFLRVRQLRD